jgi:hypothetical protein
MGVIPALISETMWGFSFRLPKNICDFQNALIIFFQPIGKIKEKEYEGDRIWKSIPDIVPIRQEILFMCFIETLIHKT